MIQSKLADRDNGVFKIYTWQLLLPFSPPLWIGKTTTVERIANVGVGCLFWNRFILLIDCFFAVLGVGAFYWGAIRFMGLLFLGFICLAKSRTGAVARGGWEGPPPTPFRGRGAVPGTATPISETTTTRYQYFNTSIFANFCITNQSVIIFSQSSKHS